MSARQKASSSASIERDLGALENGLTTLVEEFKEERHNAHEYRKDLRQVMGALSESVRVMGHELAETRRRTEERLSSIEPVLIEYKSVRDQKRGAAKLVRGLYAVAILAATAGAGFFGYTLHGAGKP